MMWRKRRSTEVGNPSRTMSVESQLALDVAVARALQYVENTLAATSLSETTAAEAGDTTSLSETTAAEAEASSGPANAVTTSTGTSDLAARPDDIDPDNMTYEELQSLEEAIGTESRGLSDELISCLPSSMYKTGLFSSDDEYECVICCMSYKNQEVLTTLPCKHHYHYDCVTRWLKINKACPVCNKDVFGS